MIHRIPLVLCLVVFPFVLNAKELGPSEQIPPGGTLRGSFTSEHYFANSDKPLLSEGHFLVAPGHGIIWSVEKPLPLTFVVTPEGMVQSIGNMPLMQISAAKMPLLARATDMIGNALGGNWNLLESDFAVTRIPTARGWQAKLTPRDEHGGIPFRSLITEGARFVDAAKVMRKDGGLETFHFSNQATSASPPTAAEIAAFAVRGGLVYGGKAAPGSK